MRVPSVKALCAAFNIDAATATKVRAELKTSGLIRTRLERIAPLIGAYDVQYIPQGRNSKSPGLWYANMGETYAVTILTTDSGQNYFIGNWGDIVERGSYV